VFQGRRDLLAQLYKLLGPFELLHVSDLDALDAFLARSIFIVLEVRVAGLIVGILSLFALKPDMF
jgi:hypothetical protein